MPADPEPSAETTLYCGAHLSVSGGVSLAIERLQALGGNALQVFVSNARQWRVPKLADEERRRFLQLRQAMGLKPIVAHGKYLINLASSTKKVRERSLRALCAELELVAALELDGLVLHPGSHGGDGEDVGIARIIEGLDQAFEETAGGRVLLEVTAGQGSTLGYRFQHLGAIFERVERPERLGICLDTCHLFAAGYDFRTELGYEMMWQEYDKVLPREALFAIHTNGSKHPAGSNKDRHAHLGRGHIGLTGFSHFLQDESLSGVPFLLETPKDDREREEQYGLPKRRTGQVSFMDRVNLAVIRQLHAGETPDLDVLEAAVAEEMP